MLPGTHIQIYTDLQEQSSGLHMFHKLEKNLEKTSYVNFIENISEQQVLYREMTITLQK